MLPKMRRKNLNIASNILNSHRGLSGVTKHPSLGDFTPCKTNIGRAQASLKKIQFSPNFRFGLILGYLSKLGWMHRVFKISILPVHNKYFLNGVIMSTLISKLENVWKNYFY